MKALSSDELLQEIYEELPAFKRNLFDILIEDELMLSEASEAEIALFPKTEHRSYEVKLEAMSGE